MTDDERIIEAGAYTVADDGGFPEFGGTCPACGKPVEDDLERARRLT